ncbi:NADP-dependent 3-hydroxy acid dehydrogenase YdfG [Propionicimonas paludicola]|uniref:NADP-dependent 3-hydroxy acid dehydrogenase YdfG n=1 Tax=Propionicimonas paludicola TaxID=185243 RepID=A0A2A9CNJ2_9ACTN|nr:SDR family oxidoreductase [Propionicimonas paludicola]PFG15898.1 NADP-dependent 3-hydroxy acid dehydrogenase YdfG [Propionicimonas paludicola]
MSRPVALVTGASSGIGRAIALALSSTHHVLVGGRDADRIAETCALLESSAPFCVDLDDEAAVAAAAAGIERLDVLVHSAGLVAYGTLAESTTQEWQQVLATNVVAPATLTRALLPALRVARGLVIFINSGAGLTAHAGWGVYAASKFALTALADSLRAEERGAIRVTSLHPGRVATPMQVQLNELEGRTYRPERYLDPDSVARAVRLAVDLPPEASLDSLRIAPV